MILAVRFLRDQGGQFALITALLLSVLSFAGFAGFEFAQLLRIEARLQDAADSAVLSAANEMRISGSTQSVIKSRVEKRVSEVFFANAGVKITPQNASIETKVDFSAGRVDVKVSANGKVPPILRYALRVEQIVVDSAAAASANTKICVVGLDPKATGVVQADHTSQLIGSNCAVFANSTARDSLKSNDSALIDAQMTCTSGGAEGNAKNFNPAPTLDCPPVGDPLATRAEPSVGSCTESKKVDVYKDMTLSPGVYCGGITVSGTAEAKLLPGLYVIKNGPLEVVNDAKLIGTDVGFYLTGSNASFQFSGNAKIDISGPESGEMAGMLLFGSRSNDPNMENLILTKNANRLVGTIYLPSNVLKVDTDGQVSNNSPYTAIIARRVHLFHASKVILNTDYDKTAVPVPDSIAGGGKATIRLVE